MIPAQGRVVTQSINDAQAGFRFLARLTGTRYDPASTVDARRRIVAFFKEHLCSSTPSAT